MEPNVEELKKEIQVLSVDIKGLKDEVVELTKAMTRVTERLVGSELTLHEGLIHDVENHGKWILELQENYKAISIKNKLLDKGVTLLGGAGGIEIIRYLFNAFHSK